MFAIRKAGWLATISAAGIFSAQALAIDFLEAAPKQTKVLLENDKVRVIRATFKKGDKVPPHSHPDFVVYVLKGEGKVKFTNADGTTTETETKAGNTSFRPALSHAHEHSGNSEAIVIELKK